MLARLLLKLAATEKDKAGGGESGEEVPGGRRGTYRRTFWDLMRLLLLKRQKI